MAARSKHGIPLTHSADCHHGNRTRRYEDALICIAHAGPTLRCSLGEITPTANWTRLLPLAPRQHQPTSEQLSSLPGALAILAGVSDRSSGNPMGRVLSPPLANPQLKREPYSIRFPASSLISFWTQNDGSHHRSGIIRSGRRSRSLAVTLRAPSQGHTLPCENHHMVHALSHSDLLLASGRGGWGRLSLLHLMSLAWKVAGS